ncbi:class E sortase [Streptantibioticus ferralitis]|uniref:Class E sortase n=1 Tax=Streptantibioticus ferralitis TaxID=236510 RepID=A0ABT5Z537_9ACTN|nr:class E sortase [Streptantibioticus ferralitis]MDF2258940.1 class E sortase [Streptantibioticus ferralitis]
MTTLRPENAAGPSRPSPTTTLNGEPTAHGAQFPSPTTTLNGEPTAHGAQFPSPTTTLNGEPTAHGARFEDTGEFEAAVEQLADPLTDPLPIPGGGSSPWFRSTAAATPPAGDTGAPGPGVSPYAGPGPAAASGHASAGASGYPSARVSAPGSAAGHAAPAAHGRASARAAAAPAAPGPAAAASWQAADSSDAVQTATLPVTDATARLPIVEPEPAPAGRVARRRAGRVETTAPLPVVERTEPEPAPGGRAARRRAARAGNAAEPPPPERELPSTPGGRAARRKAAKRGGARRATGPAPASGTDAEVARPPTSRLEARRAARAAKDSPGVIASRVLGEVFITLGVLMLLFVAYQLWWTNVLAHEASSSAANSLQHQWDSKHSSTDDRNPGAFSPGQGFAIIYLPKLDVKAPIAEGIDKHAILDKGMVGHYSGAQETAMPWAKTGNFALAGHRNTHGEPFRYINRLVPGDKVVVETASTYYTYEITSFLPQTSPSNVGVIQPIPVGSGFTRPGRYITLTTCTPEFTSTYRMIVWGKMVDVRPRGQGKPDALLGG